MAPPFEWHDDKASRNAQKHGVSFEEATTCFLDPAALIAADPEHSREEQRQWLIGKTTGGRTLVVVFTRRPGSAIRIISARPASRKERASYEKNL